MQFKKISGFGNVDHSFNESYCEDNIYEIKKLLDRYRFTIRAAGTSYGDAAISTNSKIFETNKLNKIIHFDKVQGLIRVQSGVKIQNLLEEIIPSGWFLNVTPGTSMATIGGVTSCDSHGKNFKSGSFGNFISSIKLIDGEGKILECNPNKNKEIFYSTIGGMGLTGIILEVEIILKKINSSKVIMTNVICNNINDMIDKISLYKDKYEYLYSWIDTSSNNKNLGQGILVLGNHLNDKLLTFKHLKKIKYFFKLNLINKYTVFIFNKLYFWKNKYIKKIKIVSLLDFFYPLDKVANWNNVYGLSGFIEYQCFLPSKNIKKSIFEILEIIKKNKLSVFLCSIKLLGSSKGYISFSNKGYTIAFDFPYNKFSKKVVEELDRTVIKYYGSVNLSKNSILSKKNFEKMYSKNLTKFKQQIDNKFVSKMSERLGLL